MTVNNSEILSFFKKEISGWKQSEVVFLCFILTIVLINKIMFCDSSVAVMSAVCGIMYTVISGKGKLSCYFFGICASGFYGYLALINSIWGNLVLNLGYYLPMQIFGIFKWSKNLKPETNEIYKTKLSVKERNLLALLSVLACLFSFFVMKNFNDAHPVSDSITTIFSLTGMYLTVKRCIEQWIVWSIVNLTCVIMWINIALSGERVYSTIIMWMSYFIMGIYFYFQWKKEIKES